VIQDDGSDNDDVTNLQTLIAIYSSLGIKINKKYAMRDSSSAPDPFEKHHQRLQQLLCYGGMLAMNVSVEINSELLLI